MKRLILNVEGREQVVWAQNLKGQLWIHSEGRTFMVQDREVRRARGGGAKGGAHKGEIASPMPGKVTKVLAKALEEVKRGQALVVMEAMKMEYTLNADGDGVIEEVSCQAGDQVRLGQVLVRLKVTEA